MDSLQEQIIKAVAARMATITMANGYQNTIKLVQRHEALGMDLAKMPTILVREGDCSAELSQGSHQQIRRRMEVLIVVATGIDELAEPRSGSEVLNSLAADIEKALGYNERWNNLALMTEPPEYLTLDIDAETPHLARGLRVVITYEHGRGNPYG